MNKPVESKTGSSVKPFFLLCLIVFALSACAFALVVNLDRKIVKTSGKVIDSYSKKSFVSRKQSVEQEYLVVQYEVNGKQYSGTTPRRKGGDFVPVFYYQAFPGMPWFFKKENPNMVYCCIFMTLSLLGLVLSRPKIKKAASASGQVTAKQKKK
jgi:hypothetical protein